MPQHFTTQQTLNVRTRNEFRSGGPFRYCSLELCKTRESLPRCCGREAGSDGRGREVEEQERVSPKSRVSVMDDHSLSWYPVVSLPSRRRRAGFEHLARAIVVSDPNGGGEGEGPVNRTGTCFRQSVGYAGVLERSSHSRRRRTVARSLHRWWSGQTVTLCERELLLAPYVLPPSAPEAKPGPGQATRGCHRRRH